MKNIIVIPTYWTLPENDTSKTFDHPIPIKEKGTLERLLRSLRKLRNKCEVHIVISPLHKKVENKVRRITNEFPDLDIHVFSKVDLVKIRRLFKSTKLSKEFESKINVDTYGGIRNIGLVIGVIKKIDNLIFLDDDEVVEKRDFIIKAEELMGECHGMRKKLVGKTGYYVDKHNHFKHLKNPPSWKRHWLKQKHLNKVYNNIKAKKRLHETSNALGGNMVINKLLFETVPFDPYIPRGEDLDYLLNAKHFKFRFLFDNKLVIKHLPPPLGCLIG